MDMSMKNMGMKNTSMKDIENGLHEEWQRVVVYRSGLPIRKG